MEWKELLYGGVIGGVVGFSVQKIFEIVISFNSNKGFPYLGTHHCYYYSTTGNGEVVHEVWEIKRTLLGLIRLQISEPEATDNECSFKGKVWVEGRHIYAFASGVKHVEHIFHIFPEPVTSRLGQTVGVASALTMKKQPWCGKQLLSSEQLEEKYIRLILGNERKIVSTFT